MARIVIQPGPLRSLSSNFHQIGADLGSIGSRVSGDLESVRLNGADPDLNPGALHARVEAVRRNLAAVGVAMDEDAALMARTADEGEAADQLSPLLVGGGFHPGTGGTDRLASDVDWSPVGTGVSHGFNLRSITSALSELAPYAPPTGRAIAKTGHSLAAAGKGFANDALNAGRTRIDDVARLGPRVSALADRPLNSIYRKLNLIGADLDEVAEVMGLSADRRLRYADELAHYGTKVGDLVGPTVRRGTRAAATWADDVITRGRVPIKAGFDAMQSTGRRLATPIQNTTSRVSAFRQSARYVKYAKHANGALNVASIGLDSYTAANAYANGDLEKGHTYTARALASGMMLMPVPGARVVGATIVLGTYAYEYREEIAAGAKWAANKLEQGARATGQVAADFVDDVGSGLSAVAGGAGKLLGGLW